MRRPDFGSLNPAESLTVVGNVFLINNGTRGNPDLRPQKSDSIDLTAEYYFDSGYVAVTGYSRSIKDRVVTANRQEEIGETGSASCREGGVQSVWISGCAVS